MADYDMNDAARAAYNIFRGGFKNPCPVPPWDVAPAWVRDVARVAYLQGTLNGKQQPPEEMKVRMNECAHSYSYVGVRYRDGMRPRPGTGATRRYYAHVYFCTKCTATRGQAIEDNYDHWNSYQKVDFGAVPGSADECCVPARDR